MRKPASRPMTGEGGFTLLETMISLAILGFGILAVVGLFVTSIGGNAQGRNMTEAASLAQARLDLLYNNEDYDDIDSYSNQTEANIQADASPGGRYTRFTHVTSTASLSGTPAAGLDMKIITVDVTWTNKGHEHKVEAESLRARDQ